MLDEQPGIGDSATRHEDDVEAPQGGQVRHRRRQAPTEIDRAHHAAAVRAPAQDHNLSQVSAGLDPAGLDDRPQGVAVPLQVDDPGIAHLAADEHLERAGLGADLHHRAQKLAGIGLRQRGLQFRNGAVRGHGRRNQRQGDAPVRLHRHRLVELRRRGRRDLDLVPRIESVGRLIVAPGGVGDVPEALPDLRPNVRRAAAERQVAREAPAGAERHAGGGEGEMAEGRASAHGLKVKENG